MFKWLVMPFGLSNVPACFQQFVNNIFWDMINCGVLVYLNDIRVYLQTQEEHDALVLRVLAHLCANKLYGKISKCEFDCAKVEFLGYVVSDGGLAMDQKKVKTILEWPIPKSVKEVELFPGFANFYRRFVLHYSRRVGNLTKLTHKDARFLPYAWNAAAQSDFDALKAAMSTAPVLAHFVPSQRTVLVTDASKYALGAIVSQCDEEGVLHPCGFASPKMSPAENNYPIHNKELLGIVWALHEWRSFFLSVHGAFDVVTDHNALKHFMISKLLTRRQARWAEFLADFDFTVFYRPGRIGTKPDTLLRRVDVYPSGGEGAYERNNPHNVRTLISQSMLNPWTAAPTAPEVCASIGIFRLARLAPFQ